MELALKQKLLYFFPVLFCFCLPFGSLLLSVIVILWTITSFFNLNREQIRKGFLNRNLILFYSFFALTVLSAIFSSNKEDALFGIEIKMSFILFPYLLFCFKWPVGILKRCIISFVSGCFFACLYLIARAFLYAFNGQSEYFFYSLFSDFIHASYFAMYLILAIVLVVVFYNDWFSAQKSVIYSSYFFISIFVTSIFLCSSKLGLISFFICMPALLLYKFKARLSIATIAAILVSGVALIFVSAWLFPGPFARMNSLSSVSLDNIDKTSSESTTVRILIWQEAVTLIKNNFFVGTGVGDANSELLNAYRANGLTGALEHRFNAHNQFLQTFIGLGIIGCLLLILMTFGQMIRGIVTRNLLLFIFSITIILNFMVESMLQTSAGVLFFSFFCCFFNLVGEKELRADPAFEAPEPR
jgi:O-antigen ligase